MSERDWVYPILQNIEGKYKRVVKEYHIAGHTVPEGFVTDLASIPFFLKWIFDDDDDLAPGAVVHDYLYETKPCTRSEADDIMYDIMLVTGVPVVVANIVWSGVRCGGWWAWRNR